mmetsp:Transcript_44750/g.130287  ORF Transcript_44750/g.130287 Transcript_44750/m.130287 type:complete len:235 (-) Transcript_44750:145-849(-)
MALIARKIRASSSPTASRCLAAQELADGCSMVEERRDRPPPRDLRQARRSCSVAGEGSATAVFGVVDNNNNEPFPPRCGAVSATSSASGSSIACSRDGGGNSSSASGSETLEATSETPAPQVKARLCRGEGVGLPSGKGSAVGSPEDGVAGGEGVGTSSSLFELGTAATFASHDGATARSSSESEASENASMLIMQISCCIAEACSCAQCGWPRPGVCGWRTHAPACGMGGGAR